MIWLVMEIKMLKSVFQFAFTISDYEHKWKMEYGIV